MKALGKGSIASIVQVGLQFAWWGLGACLVIWAVMALAYAGLMGAVIAGVVDPASLPAVNQNENVHISFAGVDPAALENVRWTDWQLFAPALLVLGVSLGGGLVIVDRLRRLFASFSSGDPFRRENATHLRVIWITMVVVELSRYALLAAWSILLENFAPASIQAASFSLNSDTLWSWMSILVLIALAEVFREGARLKEEQELTI